MTPMSAKAASVYQRVSVDRNFVPQGTPNVYTGVATTQKVVTCPATITKGNFRDALPWEYTVLRGNAYLQGQVIYMDTSWYPGGGTKSWGAGCGTGLIIPSMFLESAADPYNKCLGKLYDSIRGDVDLSIDLYQGRQTVKFIRDTAAALRHPLRTLMQNMKDLKRKGKVSYVTSLISNKWLEWQYGIRPSMGTIADLCGDLYKHVSQAGWYRVKARASYRGDISGRVLPVPNSFSGAYPVQYTLCTDSRRCEIEVFYSINSTTLNALSNFTSLNPLSFIYENIPYSFVLDWVYDVGGYLRNLETACMTGLEFHSGYVSRSRRRNISVKGLDYKVATGKRYYLDLKGTAEYIEFRRTVLAGLPKPQLPSLRVSLGSERLFSAASLLRNLLKH